MARKKVAKKRSVSKVSSRKRVRKKSCGCCGSKKKGYSKKEYYCKEEEIC